jgi:type I restriction enzyme, S subunit
MFETLATNLGWPIRSLSAGLRINRDSRLAIEDLEHYRIIGVTNRGAGVAIKRIVPGSELTMREYQQVSANQLMWCKVDTKNGAFGITQEEHVSSLASPNMCLANIDLKVFDPKFLQFFFQLPAVIDGITTASLGTTNRQYLKPQELLDRVRLRLPPLPEQRRIVARIEELAAKINEARGLRHQSMEEAKALTSAYLNRFFGDYYRGLAGQLKRPNWTCLNSVVTDVADGPHITPTYVAEGIPFITVLNITSGRIQFRDHKYVSADDHAQFQKRAQAEIDDVLISKDGTIGIPCVVDTDRPFSFFVSVALIKPKRSELDGKFLAWVIRAPYMQERIKSRSRGDMIRHLVLREIRELMIPLPSLPKQRAIVVELDDMQARADGLKKLQAETAAELDALLPSILDKAFKGVL